MRGVESIGHMNHFSATGIRVVRENWYCGHREHVRIPKSLPFAAPRDEHKIASQKLAVRDGIMARARRWFVTCFHFAYPYVRLLDGGWR